MTYRIAQLPDDHGGAFMRHNDGAMVILTGEEEDTIPVLLVPMIVHAKRGEAWKTTDPEQEAFARRVVEMLNASEISS